MLSTKLPSMTERTEPTTTDFSEDNEPASTASPSPIDKERLAILSATENEAPIVADLQTERHSPIRPHPLTDKPVPCVVPRVADRAEPSTVSPATLAPESPPMKPATARLLPSWHPRAPERPPAEKKLPELDTVVPLIKAAFDETVPLAVTPSSTERRPPTSSEPVKETLRPVKLDADVDMIPPVVRPRATEHDSPTWRFLQQESESPPHIGASTDIRLLSIAEEPKDSPPPVMTVPNALMVPPI